jgi:hypothetical protein
MNVIFLLQGGSGVQSVQMILATLLQACNALVFLRLLGVEKAIHVIILGGIFCLHPGFLDYYSFASDHIAFVAGDSLALLGFVLILRLRDLPGRSGSIRSHPDGVPAVALQPSSLSRPAMS